MSHISLEKIDASGDLRQAADDAGALVPDGTSRRDVMRRAGLAGAGFMAGGVLFNGLLSPAQAAGIEWSRKKSKANDAKIGNYALTLEFLEAAFYKEAVASGILKDADVIEFAKVVAGHEAAHVKGLQGLLGKAAVKSPTFDFSAVLKDEATFLATSAAVEPVGVSAYAGAGPYISQLAVVKPALAIHSVEAQHAAWVLSLLKYKFGGKDSPAPDDFNPTRSEKAVLKIVTSLNVIKG